jgi:hypothetical protein
MSSYLTGQKQYPLAAAVSDVPASLSSSGLPRPISSQKQLVSIASTTASQQAGGMVSFSIPTGPGANAYLINNSMYLRCTIKPNQTGTVAANASFQLNSQSASALINRITVQIGSQTINQINRYDYLHEILLTHATNRNYYEQDSLLLQYTTAPNSLCVSGSAPNSVDVVIPLIVPLFNNEKSFPLFLLNAPINIQIDLNQTKDVIFGNTGDFSTGYTVSNANLVFDTLQVSSEYVNAIKAEMMKGNLYQLNMHDYSTMTTQSVAAFNYMIGANYSSLRGVLYTQVPSTTATTGLVLFQKNNQTNCRLYLDGRQINNFDLSADSQIYAEFQRALGNMFDVQLTSYLAPEITGSSITPPLTARGYYTSRSFVAGISTNRVSDYMAMTGSPCQNINLVVNSDGGAFNFYIVLLVDEILTIDAMGQVMLVK